MLSNYLKIALRNLLKYKVYSLINILGLALGIACTILILLWVQDELSYDEFHTNADRIYRVTREWKNPDGETSLHLARIAPPFAPLLANEYPNSIEHIARLLQDYNSLLKIDDQSFVEDGLFWAEPAVFNIFSIEMLNGDPATALSEPNCIVLTTSIADKFFPGENPIGKTINYEDEGVLKVTGVIADMPENSHLKFDMLGSFATMETIYGKTFMETNWGSNNYLTYILLAKGQSAAELQEKLPAFIDKYYAPALISYLGEAPDYVVSDLNVLHMMKLTDIHLHSHLNSEVEQNGDINNVYLFSAIAFFILLIACINFMNLATARATKRGREIGTRKVLGAYKRQLIQQFLGESLLITFIAMLLAIVFVEFALPEFNHFTGKALHLQFFSHPLIIPALLLLTVLVGLVAGSYPAFLLSSFRPVATLKSSDKMSSGTRFRTILVVTQFAISIGLIVSMGIVYQQLEFMRSKNLGFAKERVILLSGDGEMGENIESIQSQMQTNPNILAVTSSRLIPSGRLLNSSGAQILDGDEPQRINFRLAVVDVNYNFIDTYKMSLIAGRDFSRNYATDDSASFILNRNAITQIGWTPESAIGKRMNYGGRDGIVIGVVEDMHFESLHNKIVPIIFLINPGRSYRFAVKISGNDIPGTLAHIEKIWREYLPDYPFTYDFLDDRVDAQYAGEEELGKIFGVFAMLAVVIACLGLYGLAAFTAEQRTKEMGIRKVLGATTGNLVGLLSKEFVLLVVIANLIAWPVAWFAMNKWLGTFAYSTTVGWWVFLGAGVLALIIALITVSWQAIKAALANPIKSLRYE